MNNVGPSGIKEPCFDEDRCLCGCLLEEFEYACWWCHSRWLDPNFAKHLDKLEEE